MTARRVLFAIAVLAAGGLALFFHRHYRAYEGFIVDDAAITFTYARNLAEGYGLVLNRGGETVEGYSNPVWMFLLAGGYRLGVDGFVLSKRLGLVFGIGCLVLAILLAFRLARRAAKGDEPREVPWGGLFVLPLSVLVAGSGSFVGWCASGLENAQWIFVLLLALYLHDRELSGEAGPVPWSGLALFLVTVTRPEGVAFAAALFLHRLFVRALLDRRLDRADAACAALFLVPAGLFEAWRLWTFAWPLPNTYYAKLEEYDSTALLVNFRSRGWRQTFEMFHEYRLTALLPFAAAGLVSRDALRRRLPLAGFAAAAVLFNAFTNGDWMRQYRFLLPVEIGLPVLAALGFAGLARLGVRMLPRRVLPLGLGAVAAACLAFTAWVYQPYPKISQVHARRPTATVFTIQKRAEQFRRFAEQADIRETASLLEPDMGASSYFSGLELVDVGMLTDVPLARHHFDPRFVREYIFGERRPTFMHIREAWAQRSHIPRFEEFARDHISLPDWRKPKDRARELGDYVRLDVFRRPRDASAPVQEPAAVFDGRLRLERIELPCSVWMPGREVRLRLVWSLAEGTLPPCEFALRFAGPGDAAFAHRWKPVYGWYGTARWEPGYLYQEVVTVPVPGDAARGDYALRLAVEGPDGPLPGGDADLARVLIDGEAAGREAAAAIQAASGNEDPLAGYEQYRRAIRQAGADLDPRGATRRALVGRIGAYAVREADRLLAGGKEIEAVDVLLRAREIEPRLREVNRRLKTIAGPHYRKGRELQKAGRLPEAFVEFQRALAIFPADAWARRRVEETRFSRY